MHKLPPFPDWATASRHEFYPPQGADGRPQACRKNPRPITKNYTPYQPYKPWGQKKNMRFVSTGIQHALKPGEGKTVGRRPSKLFVFLYCLTHVKPIQQRQQLVSKFIQANHLSAPVMSVLNSTERYLKWRNRISPSMRRCGLIPRQGVSIRRRKCRTTKVGGIQSYTTSPRCGSRPQKTSNAVGDSGTLYVHSMP